MALDTMWNWQSSCTNCVFYIIREVGAELECLFKAVCLSGIMWVCRNLCYPMEELLKGSLHSLIWDFFGILRQLQI
jgi:hypothetical protein